MVKRFGSSMFKDVKIQDVKFMLTIVAWDVI